MHAQLDAFGRPARDAQQLDAVTELLGVADIFLGQRGDTLGVDLVELHRDAEGDRRHDGELVRGVDALDVERRVRLGIAQALRLLQHRAEGEALVAHFGQDEVRCPVDDAGDPFDAVGGKAFAQGLDDRDAPGHRALERHHHAHVLRGSENFVAVGREQRLVGGDHMLAVGYRFQHQIAGDAAAADQLDHDIYIGVVHHFPGVGGDRCLARDQFPRARQVLVGDFGDANTAPCAPPYFLLVAREHVPGTAADRATTQQPHANRIHARRFSGNLGHSAPSFLNMSLMPRSACRERASFSISAMRT